MSGQWGHLCTHLGIWRPRHPPTQPPPVTLSKVLFQGGKNEEVLPVKKEERKTSVTDTHREKRHHGIGLKSGGRDDASCHFVGSLSLVFLKPSGEEAPLVEDRGPAGSGTTAKMLQNAD